jgi:ubiquinone/menaquinone biosynthesis C-methylase UbiE
MDISPIQAHYATGYEARRLESAHGQLERTRTDELLARYLPQPPARVIDVGGGPGVYSRSLAATGYTVQLVDIVPLHVELASQSFAQAGLSNARADLGNALDLRYEDASRDVVLLMGPLYHLPDRADRIRALREAFRVLQPGGILAATMISRYASLFDGVSRSLVHDPDFVQIMEADLRAGVHENPTHRPDYFTTAYLHHPDEARAEIAEAGFANVEVLAIEGPFWCMGTFEELWADTAMRGQMLEWVRIVEKEPSLLGASAHLFAVGRKPG